MTPERLAAMHAQVFFVPRPWSAEEFRLVTAQDSTVLVTHDEGFAIGRVIADEAELLTIAVSAEARRSGIGRLLMQAYEAEVVARGAIDAFLEVAEDNAAALALYHDCGYRNAGRRKGYYRHPDGARIDAIICRKPLKLA